MGCDLLRLLEDVALDALSEEDRFGADEPSARVAADGRLLVATDARRKEVYWATYDVTGDLPVRLAGPDVARAADLDERVRALPAVGRGPELYASELTGWPAHDRAFISDAFGCTPSETVAGIVHIGTPPDTPITDRRADFVAFVIEQVARRKAAEDAVFARLDDATRSDAGDDGR